MSWPRKQFAPKMFRILMMVLLFIVAIAPDNIGTQAAPLNAAPGGQMSSYNDDRGDAEPNSWNATKSPPAYEQETQLLHLVIKHYLKQLCGGHIPPSPSIFFQPDRAPPV